MKAIFIGCGLVLIGIIVWIVFGLREPNHYGAEFSRAPEAAVADLLDRPSDYLGKQVTLDGKVQDQCPITGCFFYFSAGNRKLRIELGDLAQKIPKRPGAPVTVEGQLVPYGDSYQFLGTAAEFQ